MSGATDWFRVSNDLPDDVRISRMAARCGVHATMILGACTSLWALADRMTPDGLLREATPEGIDLRVGVPGFCAAMAEIGWAEVRPDGVLLTGFLEKNGGTTSKKRRVDASSRTARSRHRRDMSVTPAQHERDTGVTLSTLSSCIESSDSSEGESEGKPRSGYNPNADGIKIDHIFRVYPRAGRVEPRDAHAAIAQAAEWIALNRPDIPDPLAFLRKRVEEFAASPAAQVPKYVPKAVNWFEKRRFFDDDAAWQRDDAKPARKSYAQRLAERGSNAVAPETVQQ